MITRLVPFLAVLAVAGTASAQLSARLTVGYQGLSETFDNDGDRLDIERIDKETAVPINLGIDYTFFAGLYGGAELSLLYRDLPKAEPKEKSAFGVSELDLHLGWNGSFVVDVGVDVGFKIDLGKMPVDVASDKLGTSDNQHAFHLGGHVGFSVLPMLSVGARLAIVVPLERTIKFDGGIEKDTQNGVLLDTALTLGGSAGLGAVSVLYGVDLAFLYQGAQKIDGNTVEINGDAVTHHLLHLIPYLGVGFGQHSVKVMLAAYGEDALIGIPLTGKNLGPVATIPVSFSYGFSM